MRLWRSLALVSLLLSALTASGDELSVNDVLAPEEQYRRLSLALLIGESVDDALYIRMQGLYRADPLAAPVDPDALKSPLLRIVDQPSMLAGAAHLFRIAREHGPAVGARLRALTEGHPEAVAGVGSDALREDAILVRMAVAESIEFAGWGEDPALAAALEAYRDRTLELRNLLEFSAFERELDRMTDEAIASVGSQLDAYQRMFEDEVRDDAFEHHVQTAERPYIGRKPFNFDAARLAEEVMDGVVLSESTPDP